MPSAVPSTQLSSQSRSGRVTDVKPLLRRLELAQRCWAVTPTRTNKKPAIRFKPYHSRWPTDHNRAAGPVKGACADGGVILGQAMARHGLAAGDFDLVDATITGRADCQDCPRVRRPELGQVSFPNDWGRTDLKLKVI